MLNITVNFPQIVTIIDCAENVTLKYMYSYLQQYKCVQQIIIFIISYTINMSTYMAYIYIFLTKYKALSNSAPTSDSDLERCHAVMIDNVELDNRVNFDIIQRCIKKLKPH